ADELRKPARAGYLELRPKASDPLKIVDPRRLLDSFHGEKTQILEGHEALDELCGALADIDLSRLGDLLHPCRKASRQSKHRIIPLQIVSDLPDNLFPRVEAHPHREVDSLLEPKLVSVAAKVFLEGERGVAGALCVILMRYGGAEEGHDAVSRV